MYDQIKKDLRRAYDGSAHVREGYEISTWKIEERHDFLVRLQGEGKSSLLEIGAGVGRDSKYFQDNGLQVVCIDLSPKMIDFCREKGLDARIMDFMDLDFPEDHFDALYAINSLLHVPPEELPATLQSIQRPLKKDGLFFLGLYGGKNQAGVWEEDDHDPKRFYAFYSDEKLLEIVSEYFTLVDFKRIIIDSIKGDDLHFQRLILRKL